MVKLHSKNVSFDELKGVYKQYGRTKYLPKAVKDKFRTHGFTAHPSQVISQKKAETFIKELKTEKYLKNVKDVQNERVVFRGIVKTRAEMAKQAKTEVAKLKEVEKNLDKVKSAKGDSRPGDVKSLLASSGKSDEMKDLVNEGEDLIKDQIKQEMLEEEQAGKKKAGYLGLSFLPENMMRQKFLEYLGRMVSAEAQLRLQTLLKEQNLDYRETLSRDQMGRLLKVLRDDGLIAATQVRPADSIGRRLEKYESRRKAYIKMGIADEDEGGRYSRPEDRLPEGVTRTALGEAAGEVTTSISRIGRKKTKAGDRTGELMPSTSAIRNLREGGRGEPATSINRVLRRRSEDKKKIKKEENLTDIFAGIA